MHLFLLNLATQFLIVALKVRTRLAYHPFFKQFELVVETNEFLFVSHQVAVLTHQFRAVLPLHSAVTSFSSQKSSFGHFFGVERQFRGRVGRFRMA
jgi:hypothetical protein